MNHPVSMIPNSPECDEYQLQRFQVTLIQTLMSNNGINDPRVYGIVKKALKKANKHKEAQRRQ